MRPRYEPIPKLGVLLNIHDIKKMPSYIYSLSFVPRLLLNLIKRS